MKIKLHEIELGTNNCAEQTNFFQIILGLQPNIQQDELTIFHSGIRGLDFNLSHHLLSGVAAVSFLTDDLPEIESRLRTAGLSYQVPCSSHLGMTTIQFKTRDGYCIKINTPGKDSPEWLHKLLDEMV